MLKSDVYHSGKLWGAIYDYGEEGDLVPTHSHPNESDHHNVICLKGSVSIPELGITLRQGEMIDLDCYRDHTIVALEAGSRTLHLCINGTPTFAKNMVSP